MKLLMYSRQIFEIERGYIQRRSWKQLTGQVGDIIIPYIHTSEDVYREKSHHTSYCTCQHFYSILRNVEFRLLSNLGQVVDCSWITEEDLYSRLLMGINKYYDRYWDYKLFPLDKRITQALEALEVIKEWSARLDVGTVVTRVAGKDKILHPRDYREALAQYYIKTGGRIQ